jgi:hypothetical protein
MKNTTWIRVKSQKQNRYRIAAGHTFHHLDPVVDFLKLSSTTVYLSPQPQQVELTSVGENCQILLPWASR